MIIEYHRPQNLDEALLLLSRAEPKTVPMGGGTYLNRPSADSFAVVDLQSLGLNGLHDQGNMLVIGATLTLQELLDERQASNKIEINLPQALKIALSHEGTYNLRQTATVAGALVSADGRSPFATTMLALGASLELLPGNERIKLGDLLPLREERLRGRLITQVSVPLNIQLSYQSVARSPADLPIVCAAVAKWPSGRTRVALGGHGDTPVLAFDGTESGGADVAARSAFSQARDEWASADYRQEMAGLLTKRCLDEIKNSL